MKKLTMKVDDLRVDSFSTAPEVRHPRGTVRAHLEPSQVCGWTPQCLEDTLQCTMLYPDSWNCLVGSWNGNDCPVATETCPA